MSTRLVRLRAMRSLFWLLRRGGGPGFGAMFEVCGQSSLARVAWATRRLFCAALWLMCGFGAEWCKSGRRPQGWWCVLGAFGGLASCGRRSPRLCGFSALFSLINRVFVWFFDPVLLINWANSYLLYELQERPALFERFLEKKRKIANLKYEEKNVFAKLCITQWRTMKFFEVGQP